MPFLTIAMRKRPKKWQFITKAIGKHPMHFLTIMTRKPPTKKVIRNNSYAKTPTPKLTWSVLSRAHE